MCLTFLWFFFWAPPGIVPLPQWCAGWRRRRMPFLILPGKNRCKSLFSRLTVKTVQFGQRFVEVRTISHRSDFSRFIERDPPMLFVSKVLGRHAIGEIFLRHLVHLDAYFFSSINSELRVTKCWIFLEAVVDSFKILFDASLFSIRGKSVSFVLQSSHDDCHEVAPS